jgi:outer membrane protein TolC
VLSLSDDIPLTLQGSLDDATTLPPQPELLAGLASRPDVQAIGAQRQTAERAVALANADYKPSLALAGNLQYQQDGFNDFVNADNRSYSLGIALRVPLLGSPTASAKRATALAQVRAAEHGLKAAVDGGRLEIGSAYTAWIGAREIVTVQEKAVELAREGLSIAEVSYQNGVITSTELNDARQSLLETEWELQQAKYAQIVAAARAKLAAGAG